MLETFWNLNDEPNCLKVMSPTEFIDLVQKSNGIQNALFMPDELQLERPQNNLQNLKFKNVSFSKTKIRGIEFKHCDFEDCLFIGTEFDDCEFHYCSFVNCNPYKVRFSRTYIDPEIFLGMLTPEKHSNIGVILFQQLLLNSAEMRQSDFAATAEFNFRKWKRHQLAYEYKNKEITKWNYRSRRVRNLLNQWVLGYGVRARHFLASSSIFLSIIILWNYLFWGWFSMQADPAIKAPDGIASIYFTVITLATLGYGDITPTSIAGMLMISVEVLLGFLWLGLLLSVVVKKVFR